MQLLRARRRATAIFAVLALLCAQAVALVHAVAHPHAQAAALAAALEGPAHPHDHGLFGAQHDEGSPQCQLLDQLSHGNGLAAPAAAWTFAAPEPVFTAAPAVVAHATRARGYHARGPPTFLA